MDQADDCIPSWKLKPSSSVSHFCLNFQDIYAIKHYIYIYYIIIASETLALSQE